jgi:hypothetical protein
VVETNNRLVPERSSTRKPTGPLSWKEKYMPIPTNLQADVQRLFDMHDANPAHAQVDEILGGYTDGLSSDGTQFIALCLFPVGSKELQLLHVTSLQNRIAPLGKDPNNCSMDVFGFASNTTNAHWSHEQNNNLALDRMDQTRRELINDGVPSTLVVMNFDSGELGDPGVEDPDERFSMVVVNLAGATPPVPLTNP